MTEQQERYAAEPAGSGADEAESRAYQAWVNGLDERETRHWSYPGQVMRPAFKAGYAAGADAERERTARVVKAVQALADRLTSPITVKGYQNGVALPVTTFVSVPVNVADELRAALADLAGGAQ